MGPTTGPKIAPTPHIASAAGCSRGGNVASSTACPIGMIGAPNAPCATRNMISVSRLPAIPHRIEDAVKPSTVENIRVRQPRRAASQPVIGVATAVATRLSVMTQEISSWVADSVPRICGSTRLAIVIVMPNRMFDSWIINRISHCRPVMLKIPPPWSALPFTCGRLPALSLPDRLISDDQAAGGLVGQGVKTAADGCLARFDHHQRKAQADLRHSPSRVPQT